MTAALYTYGHVSLARHNLLVEEASCDSCIVHLHVSLALGRGGQL